MKISKIDVLHVGSVSGSRTCLTIIACLTDIQSFQSVLPISKLGNNN